MAIDAKVSFMDQLEKGLADVLTVEQMARMKQLTVSISRTDKDGDIDEQKTKTPLETR